MAAIHEGGVPLGRVLALGTRGAEFDRLTREVIALLLAWWTESARRPILAGARTRTDEAVPQHALARLRCPDGIHTLAFSRDGAQLFAGDDAGRIRSWETSSKREFPSRKAHGGRVVSLTLSADGKTLASAGADDRVKVWEADSGKLLATFVRRGAPVYPPRISLGSDDATIACGSGMDVLIWDPARNREVRKIQIGEFRITSVSHAPDGKRLASADGYGNVRLWDLATAKDVWETPVAGAMYVVFSTRGNRIAGWGVGKDITLWTSDSGAELGVLKGSGSSVSSVCFSPDGTTVASGADDGTVRLWDVDSKSEVLTRIGHSAPVTSVAFSPGGLALASADERGFILLWDVSKPR